MPPPKDKESQKRKADVETGNERPKKMTKEEKQAARERARQAMTGGTNSTAAAAAATTTSAAAPAPAPRKRKAAAKKTPTSSVSGNQKKASTAASATSTHESEKPAMEMPLPPTSLRRTQSTPLELELEQQVVANLKADMEGKAPVFTQAPPEHLLKFAPKELEEGYDHDENNVGDEEDEDDTFPATTSSTIHTNTVPKQGYLLDVLVFALWLYLFYGRQGTFYHRWSYGIVARIPLPNNPYRINGKPIPYDPCFKTNVVDPPIGYPMPPQCEGIPLTTCPLYAECYGGSIRACAEPFLTLGNDKKSCRMIPSAQRIYDHVLNQVTTWSMDHHCDRSNPTYSKLFENYDQSPSPHMMISLKETNTKQPMFKLDYILDLEPFILNNAPKAVQGRNPLQTLYRLIEAGNNVNDHALKLQILTQYGPEVGDEGEREVQLVHLVAQVPNSNWSLTTQCSLLRTRAAFEFAMRTPWLVAVWMFCMALFWAWVLFMGYYWNKAQEQQKVLNAIEVIRHFVIETLQSSQPKQWKGSEMLEYVVRNGPKDVYMEETLLRKRIWPRVCFDIRGNNNIEKSVIVSGGDLVDMWVWQPKEQQPAAQETEGDH